MRNFFRIMNRYSFIYIAIFIFLTFGCGKEETSQTPQALEETGKIDKVSVKEKKVAVKLPELDDTDYNGYYNFGVETIKKGNFDLAIEAWKKAIEINPEMVKAYSFLGRAYYTYGMMDEAIEAYKKTVEFEPGNPKALINLGIAYRYNDMLEESIAEFNKAIEINPLSALAYDEIGMALLKQEKHDEAIAAYKNAVAIDAKFPQPHNHLGVVYLLKGMTKEASEQFDLFETLDQAKKAKQTKLLSGQPH